MNFGMANLDFKSLLSAQMNPASSKASTETRPTRRAALEAEREAQYRAEQDKIAQKRDVALARKRKAEEDEEERRAVRQAKKQRIAEEARIRREKEEVAKEKARRKRLGLPEREEEEAEVEGDLEGDPSMPDIPENLLQSRLKKLLRSDDLPDEKHRARLKRYYTLLKTEDRPIPTTLTTLPEEELKMPPNLPARDDSAARTTIYRHLASYLNMLLSEWSRSLALRDQEVKDSFAGKAVTNGYLSALDTMKPLFRSFEAGDLAEDLLKPLVDIVRAIQERRYVDANNGYLTLSIGKAAWPIGVTMVGIHERSAREKLHGGVKEGGKAHIMSDEKTRKWLQSVKRCLTFAQTRWPPDDMSQLMG